MDRSFCRLVFGTLVPVILLGSLGCQCTCLYEPYGDLIDEVSDCPPRFDEWYSPCLDLTRIGKPDWCQCRWNRRLCGGQCCDCGKRQYAVPLCYEDAESAVRTDEAGPPKIPYDDIDVPTVPAEPPAEQVPPPPDAVNDSPAQGFE